jgi:uncharacterized protein
MVAEMPFDDLPRSASWRHCGGRSGFEVVFVRPDRDGVRFEGATAAVEQGEAWIVEYVIAVGRDWSTRRARVRSRSGSGSREVELEADGAWRIDGVAVAHLDGCLDVDLESSALTNAFPVRRLRLGPGATGDAPAAYVRAADLAVERLEQRYLRIEDGPTGERYRYAAPVFEFQCELSYDQSRLVVEYPGLAVREA